MFKMIPGHLGIIEVLCWLTPAETWARSPAAMPLALCFNELIWQCTLKLAKNRVLVTAAGRLWCSLRCNSVFYGNTSLNSVLELEGLKG